MYVHHGIHELIFNFVGTLEASQVGEICSATLTEKCILYCENVLQSVIQGIFRPLCPEGLALVFCFDRQTLRCRHYILCS